MIKTGLLSIFLLVVTNNAYAHGMPTSYFVVAGWPTIIALGILVIAIGRTLISKPSWKWYLASIAIYLIQIPWSIYLND